MTQTGSSPLSAIHEESAASFLEWCGVSMPAAFDGPEEEMRRINEGSLGLVDTTGLGIVRVAGADRAGFLHRLTTADVRSFAVDTVHDGVFVSGKGRILFSVRIWTREDDIVLLNRAPGAAGIVELLERYHFSEDVSFEDAREAWRVLRVIGDKASARVAETLGGNAPDAEAVACPRPGMAILAGPWQGGCEIVIEPEQAVAVWRELVTAGMTPVGRVAYDALRIEHGLAEPAAELTEEANPLEAGMHSALSFRKGCYVGQEVIARLDTYDKVSRHLSVLRLVDGAAVAGDRLVVDDRDAGVVTSVSPLVAQSAERLALGYVKKAHLAEGTELEVRDPDGQSRCRAIQSRIV